MLGALFANGADPVNQVLECVWVCGCGCGCVGVYLHTHTYYRYIYHGALFATLNLHKAAFLGASVPYVGLHRSLA